MLIVFGTWFNYKIYQTAHEDIFIDGIILFAIAVVGLIIFVRTIVKDYKDFKSSHQIKSYIPTSIGLLFILLAIGLVFYQNNRLNSPTLISGFNDGGFNSFSVDFKVNGNYVMTNGSGLGQSYFYGKYRIQDSIITIDKTNIDNWIKTNKLIIKTDNYFIKDSSNSPKLNADFITQIDNAGNEIDKEFRFRVTEDNRNK